MGRGGSLQKLVMIEEAASRILPSAESSRLFGEAEERLEEPGQTPCESGALKCPQQAVCSDFKEVSWLGTAQMGTPS